MNIYFDQRTINFETRIRLFVNVYCFDMKWVDFCLQYCSNQRQLFKQHYPSNIHVLMREQWILKKNLESKNFPMAMSPALILSINFCLQHSLQQPERSNILCNIFVCNSRTLVSLPPILQLMLKQCNRCLFPAFYLLMFHILIRFVTFPSKARGHMQV